MSRHVEASSVFAVSPAAAFGAYWELENWPAALDDVVSVHAEYDDGVHQSFSMTVRRPGGEETVRGVRFNAGGRRLELCQFEPPPGFSLMTGAWSFEPLGENLTRVRAERRFEMQDDDQEDRFAPILGGLLARNLAAFKALVERSAP